MRASPERMFKSHYPKATIERHRVNDGSPYYLVRKSPREFTWAGSGDTKSQA